MTDNCGEALEVCRTSTLSAPTNSEEVESAKQTAVIIDKPENATVKKLKRLLDEKKRALRDFRALFEATKRKAKTATQALGRKEKEVTDLRASLINKDKELADKAIAIKSQEKQAERMEKKLRKKIERRNTEITLRKKIEDMVELLDDKSHQLTKSKSLESELSKQVQELERRLSLKDLKVVLPEQADYESSSSSDSEDDSDDEDGDEDDEEDEEFWSEEDNKKENKKEDKKEDKREDKRDDKKDNDLYTYDEPDQEFQEQEEDEGEQDEEYEDENEGAMDITRNTKRGRECDDEEKHPRKKSRTTDSVPAENVVTFTFPTIPKDTGVTQPDPMSVTTETKLDIPSTRPADNFVNNSSVNPAQDNSTVNSAGSNGCVHVRAPVYYDHCYKPKPCAVVVSVPVEADSKN